MTREQDELRELIREAHAATKDLRQVMKEFRQLGNDLNDRLIATGIDLAVRHEARVVQLSDDTYNRLETKYREYFDGLAAAIKTDKMKITHIALMRSDDDTDDMVNALSNVEVYPPDSPVTDENESGEATDEQT